MAFGATGVYKWVFGRSTTSEPGYALQVGSSPGNGNSAALTNGGTWVNASDKNMKEDFTGVNGIEILQKLRSLEVMKWKYKSTNEYHIGPTAQDFYSLFQLGLNDKAISTIDPAGILLIAVKEQQKQIEELKKEINQLKKKRN
jgi:hypothetical protein